MIKPASAPLPVDPTVQRTADFLKKYWALFVFALVVIMASIGAYQYYQYSLSLKADAGSVVFFEARNAIDEKRPLDALALLNTLHSSTVGYDTIAYFTSAAVYISSKNFADANAQLLMLLDDSRVPNLYKGLARLYLSILAYNDSRFHDSLFYLEPILSPSQPWYLHAMEMQGLVLYTQKDYTAAYTLFRTIADHDDISPAHKQRIEDLMVLASVHVHAPLL